MFSLGNISDTACLCCLLCNIFRFGLDRRHQQDQESLLSKRCFMSLFSAKMLYLSGNLYLHCSRYTLLSPATWWQLSHDRHYIVVCVIIICALPPSPGDSKHLCNGEKRVLGWEADDLGLPLSFTTSRGDFEEVTLPEQSWFYCSIRS